MVFPLGEQGKPQQLIQLDKLANGQIKFAPLLVVQYVPLVKK